MANDLAAQVLQRIDKLLAERPDKIGHEFSEATRCMTAYRDALVVAWRESRSEADRVRMVHANSVLSVVVGAHYPLGGVPWPHLEKARDLLADLAG